MRRRLLDLFCGAGGAAMGYYRAGFDDILGVDIEDQPNYPFRFVQADASQFLNAMIDGQEDIGYDLIHASPPCQRFSVATRLPDLWPDLINDTRESLNLIRLPYVIENVPRAGLAGHVVLCGSMFGLQIQRHRSFELSEHWSLVLTAGCNHLEWEAGRPHTVTGHASGVRVDYDHDYGFHDLAHAQQLMGMPWARWIREVTEAIPPAYTQFLGEQFLTQVAA